jgi:Xaa-Pro aminopeptidase
MSKYQARIERLRGMLEELKIDSMIVSQPESRFYMSGYTGHDLPPRDSAGFLLVGAKEALLLTDPRTTEQAESEATDFEVVSYGGGVRASEKLVEVVQKIGSTRVGFESVHLPHIMWETFQRALAGQASMVPQKDCVDRLRAAKDPAELADLQKAIDILDECWIHVARHELRPGRTENEISAEITRYLEAHNSTTSFPSIVASGPNASRPHHSPTDRVIEEGEPIKMDIGAMWNGYCSDMTRTVCIGEPTAKLVEIYNLVLEAQQKASREVRVGMTGVEADALARDVIKAAGYGDNFTHSLGHGIGLEVHEPPTLSIRGEEPLVENMVFSIEPGVYIPGWGGVRIEDLVVLGASGARTMTKSPKGLKLSEVLA